MINTPQNIRVLIELLKERKVFLTHACQLDDFKSYLKLGGVPSRKLLDESGFSFTPFESDEADKLNDVWSKAFCNLQDLGTSFHMFKTGVPTPYGPILIKLDPEVLSNAVDVAVCLKSAGAANFNRSLESLVDVASIEKLFVNPKGHKYSENIHFTTQLKEIFNEKDVKSSPEVSVAIDKLNFGSGGSKISYIESIIVDRLDFPGIDLISDVKQAANYYDAGLGKKIFSRYSKNQIFYDFLVKDIVAHQRNFVQFKNAFGHIEGDAKKLIALLTANTTEYMYDRFSKYLIKGTLKELGIIPKVDNAVASSKVQNN